MTTTKAHGLTLNTISRTRDYAAVFSDSHPANWKIGTANIIIKNLGKATILCIYGWALLPWFTCCGIFLSITSILTMITKSLMRIRRHGSVGRSYLIVEGSVESVCVFVFVLTGFCHFFVYIAIFLWRQQFYDVVGRYFWRAWTLRAWPCSASCTACCVGCIVAAYLVVVTPYFGSLSAR